MTHRVAVTAFLATLFLVFVMAFSLVFSSAIQAPNAGPLVVLALAMLFFIGLRARGLTTQVLSAIGIVGLVLVALPA